MLKAPKPAIPKEKQDDPLFGVWRGFELLPFRVPFFGSSSINRAALAVPDSLQYTIRFRGLGFRVPCLANRGFPTPTSGFRALSPRHHALVSPTRGSATTYRKPSQKARRIVPKPYTPNPKPQTLNPKP